MDASDRGLIELLRTASGLNVRVVESLLVGWEKEGLPGERLCAFLERQGLIPTEHAATLKLAAKGYVALADVSDLLDREAILAWFAKHSSALIGATASAPATPVPVQAAAAENPSPAPREIPEEAPDSPGHSELPTVAEQEALRPTEWVVPTRSTAGARQVETRATPSSATPFSTGQVLGRYLLLELLGQGSAGIVYRALHQTLNIPVAIKVLRSGAFEEDPWVRQQLQLEARLLAQLNHPNIVRVWDFDDSADRPYLVLEFVEGLSLQQLIQQSGKLRVDRAIRIVLQVAHGLAAAHHLGIVHRDVKPGNILLTRSGEAKLTDLGLAVVAGSQRHSHHDSDSSRPGLLAGTAAYMAPEQSSGADHIDHRADIYALGVTFYQAVTGKLPFEGKTLMEVVWKHARQTAIPPHELAPDVPITVSNMIAQMMAKDPLDRYDGYDELLAELGGICRALDAPVAAAPPTEIADGMRTGGPTAGPSDADAAVRQSRKRWRSWLSFLGNDK
jgi:hypothetical protein